MDSLAKWHGPGPMLTVSRSCAVGAAKGIGLLTEYWHGSSVGDLACTAIDDALMKKATRNFKGVFIGLLVILTSQTHGNIHAALNSLEMPFERFE
ncbi:hypothetical protein [Azohydromonas lata]|uniref:hypothetical protein n=1 Tax=Azohydromonas lata TaxID=45677 RepID=UPI0012F4EF19|nr:hypothetical protein [Azohydromonas lata]